jgi:sugar phosphate isomerase/epimerase
MKIGMSTYSIRSNLTKGVYNFENFGFISQKFSGIQGLEILDGQMEKSLPDTEIKDLIQLKKRINNAGLEWFCITMGSGEFSGNMVPAYYPMDEYLKGFERNIDFRIGFASEWIEKAGELGIKLMRIDCAPFFYNHRIPLHKAIAFNIEQDAMVYNSLCDVAKSSGITICIENHGGFASDPQVLSELMKQVPLLKLCYDIGNCTDEDRYEIVKRYKNRIGFIHAKTYEFKQDGEEKFFDFKRIINQLKDVQFNGWLSIEFEGPGSEDTGVTKTLNLLKKYV